MKAFMTVLVAGLVLGLSSLAMAKDPNHAKAPELKQVHGVVVSVSGTDVVVKAGRGNEAKETTIKTDDKTVVTIDGAKSTVSALAAGQRVHAVLADSGVATKIDATTAPKPKKDKPAS